MPDSESRPLELRAPRRNWILPVALGLVAALCLSFAAYGFSRLITAAPSSGGKWQPVLRSEIVIDEQTKSLLLDTKVMPLSTADAARINAERPADEVRPESAQPFVVKSALRTSPQFLSALDCLTQAVYYEAGFESDAGKRAVAQVILNRVRHPAFPKSVCGVVYQGSERSTGCQFTFTCDGSLARQPAALPWHSARRVAAAALSGWVERSVGTATHYHANYVVPYWAASLNKVTTIGAHIFYAMKGSLGSTRAFSGRYDFAAEIVPAPMAPIDAASDAAAALPGLAETLPTSQPTVSPIIADDNAKLVSPANGSAELDRKPQSGLRADEERGQLLVPDGKLN